LVVDLIAPIPFELAESPEAAWRTRQLAAHVAAADLILCTNQRQRELLHGIAVAQGTGEEGRIRVVPHGLDAERPRATARPLREAGLVAEGDRVAIWAGGIWGWLDPLTPIRAIERLRRDRPEAKLAFVGIEAPGTAKRPLHASRSEEALGYISERRLEGDAVVLLPGRLESQDYLDHLIEADVGVSAHPPSLEGRYATRTRIVDYLYAGLPVVATRGETMADFAVAHGVGLGVEPLDVEGFAAALDEALFGDSVRAPTDEALAPLQWRKVAQPLVRYCFEPDSLPPRRRGRAVALSLRQYGSFVRSIHRTDGPGAIARAALRRLPLRRRPPP
jgi:glycosyltransferase involved in cell wall biosynthesis